MASLSERDSMLEELIKLKIANRLMDEEMARLQPELEKYENFAHPAAQLVQAEAVSTSPLSEKTKEIKQDTSKLKVFENDLSAINEQVATLFNEVETKVSERDSLLSEIEQATSMMNSLTVGCPQFEEDFGNARTAVHKESDQLISMTSNFHNKIKEKLSKLEGLKKSRSDLDRTIMARQQRIKVLHEKKAEIDSKIDLTSLANMKEKLGDMTEKTGKLKEYLDSVTKDEDRKMENLRSTITECEMLKKKKSDLSKELEDLKACEEKTVSEMEEKMKEVEESQGKLNDLAIKKEDLSKNHEIIMAELKERTDPIIEALKMKKDAAQKNLEAVKKRIENREECHSLRKELDASGKVEVLDLSEEIKSLKQEIEDTRANITKAIGSTEKYRSTAERYNAETDELFNSNKRRRAHRERKFHEKDGVANHFEREVFNLKKKLEREKVERQDRLAQETRRLLEKANKDKERKEREDKRRIEKEKEKMRKAKEDEDKKLKKAKEEQEKKKKNDQEKEKQKMDEAKNRAKDVAEDKDEPIRSRVQQRRLNMETAASVPFAYNSDGSLTEPPVNRTSLPSAMNLRSHNVPKKPMYILDDDSSEDDDDDMSDFLLDDSTRVMPKVPSKYASTPPRVNKQHTPLNSFDLSFADVQSSTPVKTLNDPSPSFDISFSQVVTSTPQVPKGSKANKKQTRPRGKKKTK